MGLDKKKKKKKKKSVFRWLVSLNEYDLIMILFVVSLNLGWYRAVEFDFTISLIELKATVGHWQR